MNQKKVNKVCKLLLIAGIVIAACIIPNRLNIINSHVVTTTNDLNISGTQQLDIIDDNPPLYSEGDLRIGLVAKDFKEQATYTNIATGSITTDTSKIGKKIKISVKKTSKEKLKKEQLVAKKESKKLGIKKIYQISESLNSQIRTYMHASSITCKSSNQWNLLHDEKHRIEEDEKGLVLIDGRYAVALGSYFCNVIGSKIDIEFTDGTVINCIMGDQKADKDTDPTHRFHIHDNSVLEFIVADDYKPNKTGTINWTYNWDKKIKTISILGLDKGQSTQRISIAQQNQLAKEKQAEVDAVEKSIKISKKRLTRDTYKKAEAKWDKLGTSATKTQLEDKLKDVKKKIEKKEKKEEKKKAKEKAREKKEAAKKKVKAKAQKDTQKETQKETHEIETAIKEKVTEKVTETSKESQTEKSLQKDSTKAGETM